MVDEKKRIEMADEKGQSNMADEKAGKPEKSKQAPKIEAWRTHPEGYPRLSEFMGLKPETLIFRKFVALNARMLLYTQAELVALEDQLHIQEERDNNDAEGNRKDYATNFTTLRLSHKDGDTTQLELVKKIHDKLKAYNKALIRHHALNDIPEPSRFDLTAVQRLFDSNSFGPYALMGEDATLWGHCDGSAVQAPDLIVICPREDVDHFTSMVWQHAVHLFKFGLGRILPKDPHLNNVYYVDTVINITRWITSSIAAVLPIACIVFLTNVHSQQTKLWTIAAFNVVFTFCLTFFTKAKPAEVFAVTAAFAAVQVVFLGQEFSN